jgi:hypothetical protein
LNFAADDTIANQVTVGIDQRELCLYSSRDVDVVIDLAGYFTTTADPNASQVVAATGRLWDTRERGGITGQTLELTLDAPADVTAVSVNITSTNTPAAGYATAYACELSRPVVSNLNFAPQRAAVPNHATVALGASRRLCVYVSNPADLVVDLTGWWTTTAPGAVAAYLTPERVVDTRTHTGADRLTGGQPLQVIPPAPGRRIANLTATASTTRGWVALFPCAGGYPGTSNGNFEAGQDVANAVIVDATSGVCAQASVDVDIVVDVTATVTESN